MWNRRKKSRGTLSAFHFFCLHLIPTIHLISHLQSNLSRTHHRKCYYPCITITTTGALLQTFTRGLLYHYMMAYPLTTWRLAQSRYGGLPSHGMEACSALTIWLIRSRHDVLPYSYTICCRITHLRITSNWRELISRPSINYSHSAPTHIQQAKPSRHSHLVMSNEGGETVYTSVIPQQ